MINWYRVFELLKPLCPEEVSTIDDVLRYLYVEKKLSLAAITGMTDREILCPNTLRTKLHSIGIEIKNRGGDNSTKPIPLSLEELEKIPIRQLARKYDVHISTIYNKKKVLLRKGGNI